jgi:anti-sigma regulatory factor (Ser/Thr protein kinase)
MRTTTRRSETHRIFSAIAHPSVVRAARDFAAGCLAAWGIGGDQADDVVLVVSELATNAIRAAEGFAITLSLRQADDASLVVELWDPMADDMPFVRESGPDDESGRGLHMVSLLTKKWGVRPENGGKTIYAVIAAEGR